MKEEIGVGLGKCESFVNIWAKENVSCRRIHRKFMLSTLRHHDQGRLGITISALGDSEGRYSCLQET